MAKRCRDCKRCTESSAKRMVMSPGRAVVKPVSGTGRLFKKKCRQCGHPLSWHDTIDGRFKD